ncbi:MAG: NAD(P)/FAD-dependent oxidoreductase, partial [Candidatus Micrarchaeaceae archaeon]
MAEDVIIIGSGPAGYTAAVYCAREDFKPLMFTGIETGGQLMLTTMVENYPGFPDGVLGPDLMDLFKKQAERFGTRCMAEYVTDIDLSSRPFKVMAESGTYEANSIIISTGASAKWLGLESEKRLIGKGISSCAVCDGPFFKNKDVVLVGGGDTAMEDSFFLTKFAKTITIVHRRNEFRASKIMQQRVLNNPKIKIIFDSTIEEVLGTEKVAGVMIKNLKDNTITEMK